MVIYFFKLTLLFQIMHATSANPTLCFNEFILNTLVINMLYTKNNNV